MNLSHIPLLNRVLIGEFYRKNALFFGLLLAGLVFVFRPPTTLIQPYFVLSMFEDFPFFWIVQGVLLLYQVKAWRETVVRVSLPENRFLLSLISLPLSTRWMGWSRVYAGIMAPATGYRAVVMGYSIWQGTAHVYGLMLGEIGLLILWGIQCEHLLWNPRERSIKLGWQDRLIQAIRPGWVWVPFQLLWARHRIRLILTKGGILGLLALAIGLNATGSLSTKGWNLIFLSLGILQIMFAYFLRQEEEDCLYLFRNLPLSRWQRWGGYMAVYLLLLTPELFLLGFMPGNVRWIVEQMTSFLTLELGLLMLGTGLTCYKSLETEMYLQWMFGGYVVAFFVLLFGLPGWGVGIAIGLFGTWIGMEEYWRFQPVFKEEDSAKKKSRFELF